MKASRKKKLVFHTTRLGNREKIEQEGWLVTNNPRHDAYYGRGIYFWELEEDAHALGKLWYKGQYEIVPQNIFLSNNFECVDINTDARKNSNLFSRSFIDRGVNLLWINRAYLSHRDKIRADGHSCVYLVDLSNMNSINISEKEIESNKIIRSH